MSRVTRVIALALCVGVAGCSSSWMPSWDFSLPSSAPPATTILLESEPAGADARTSVGPGCRTPCSVAVPTTTDFTVTFTLAGFQPLTVPVTPIAPTDPRDVGQGIRFDPSPVFAQLEPAPPPPTKGKKRSGPKGTKTSTAPKQ